MAETLPAEGRAWDALRAEMEEMKRDDLDWRRGRHAAERKTGEYITERPIV